VEHFQTHPGCRVAVLSLLAASTGISLTEASKVIFAELCWTPSVLNQAEDRIHRLEHYIKIDFIFIFYMKNWTV
jgi:SWI/SNF-related matrix-associated actin-dependent regulator 1 of chromatin subfamily A